MKKQPIHDFVNIATFNDVMDANMTKAELELYGVKSRVFNEHVGSLYPMRGLNIYKIYLAVRSEDEAEAVEILEKLRSGELSGG